MALGTTILAGDIFTALNWSNVTLPSRMDPGNNTPNAITVNKAMTNAVTSANIDLNGYVSITSAGSIDCHGANLTMEDDCSISGNITNCGTLVVQPSTSGGTNAFVVGVGVTIGAATVVVQPFSSAALMQVAVPLAAVQVVPQADHRATLVANLACASLAVTGRLWGDNNTGTAACGVAVSGAIVNSGTMNLLTSIAGGSITNTGTISNSTIAGPSTIVGSGTLTGCTATGGPVQCFGVTNGGSNTGAVLFAAELATFLNAEIAA